MICGFFIHRTRQHDPLSRLRCCPKIRLWVPPPAESRRGDSRAWSLGVVTKAACTNETPVPT